MAVTIIHCADLHFDSPFSGLDSIAKAEIRREELRQVFGKITGLAASKQADALVICGDLFDQQTVSAQTLRYIKEKLDSIPQIPVFLCAGNHDPNMPGSYYRILDWGKHVHIFTPQMERVDCGSFDVYGASFGARTEPESKLTGFRVKNPDKINIMALHADMGGEYQPFSRQEAEESGLDYLALGHIHQYSGAMQFGNTVCVYPGCPEGRGFDELGEKGVVQAVISKEKTELEFIPLCKRMYHEVAVDVSGAGNYETLCGRILLAMDGSADDLYKIILKGEAEFSISPSVILENLHCFMAKVKDQTSAKVDWESVKNEFSLKGLFVKKLLNQQTEENAALIKQAMTFAMQALAGEKVKLL